jgi:hypothetical protein
MSELRIRDFNESTPMDGDGEYLDFSNTSPADLPENTDLGSQDEPVIEPVNPTPENIGNDELPENSSLEPETQEPPIQNELNSKVEINDELALKYLNEKLGKQVNSFDELIEVKVENPLNDDPYLKSLYEWRQKTGRPIEEFQKYQKDYNSVDDFEVARELLQLEYPTLTSDEIQLELERYAPDELDDDREAAYKRLELKKLATRGREVLSSFKADLEKPSEALLSPELKQDLELARTVKENYARQQEETKVYSENIRLSSQKTETFEINLGDDLKLNFRIPDESKKELPTLIETMPHWRNEDGSWNHQAVVNDAIKIKHFDDMLKLAYEQGLNSGKEELIAETKNITLDSVNNTPQPNSSAKVQIEGLDDYLGNRGVKLRF